VEVIINKISKQRYFINRKAFRFQSKYQIKKLEILRLKANMKKEIEKVFKEEYNFIEYYYEIRRRSL